MDPTLIDTIDMHGDPLAFRVRLGGGRTPLLGAGRDVIKIEARQMAGHSKEAVATEGEGGSGWRLTSDEGKHLKGTDLAPFPLGFFNAGMQADLYGRMRRLAAERSIALDGVAIRAVNHYWLTGSFIQGTGEGATFPRSTLDKMLDAAMAACDQLFEIQRAALELPYPGTLPESAEPPKKAFGS